MKKTMNITEAAKELGFSRWKVYELINSGYLIAYKLSTKKRGLRIFRTDLEAFIQSTEYDPHA